LYEYVKSRFEGDLAEKPVYYKASNRSSKSIQGIDRTAKLYIGGKQVRPDGGYSIPVNGPQGQVGEVGLGNRKDIRNAVEAAHAQNQWGEMTGHARAQVLYFLAENLEARNEEFAQRLVSTQGIRIKDAREEVSLSVQRIFYYAAQADKYDGQVHHTIHRNVTLAMPEALGVMGVVCPDEFPLLGLISTVIPAIAMGNTVVAIPSETAPLSATDLYQVLETSDVPAGVVNLVTGEKDTLVPVLAAHLDVDGIWHFGNQELGTLIEKESADNMKRTWVNHGKYRDWRLSDQGQGDEFLRRATQVKNIWIPYGA
jgi:aldehyde dehydrogenase (NAD+)